MIVLDTNVVSEIMKPEPARDVRVVAWLRGLAPDDVFITTLTVAEIFAGVEAAPSGRRKDEMVSAAQKIIGIFEDRTLSFDAMAARRYGAIKAQRRTAGLHHDHAFDLQIAAIASNRDCPVATRDTGDFAGMDVKLINPWDQPAP